jgi:tripartite-type tricarboxylate transporter receptor subunit TctC
MRLLSALLIACAALVAPAKAQAPAWPQKQVTIIVPFGAGGTTDLFARILGQALQAKYGTAFVVENRPGAGGNIGATAVARAPADGHTLLVGTVSTHAINPFLYKNLPHDTEKDFQPVSLIARLPNLLVVNPTIPAKTVAELVEHVKKNPDSLKFGSSGVGTSTHLAAELFQIKTGTKMTHVPYRSSGDVMNAILGGHIDLTFDNMTLAWPQAQSGKVRAIGVTSTERSATAPDVPTIGESLPGFDATSCHGLWVPPATPRPIVETLAAEVKRIFEQEEVRKRLAELGAVASPMTPEEFARFITAERAKWQEVVKAANVQTQ